MKKHRKVQTSAQKGASDKDQKEMLNRIRQRLRKIVGAGLYFDILEFTANDMFIVLRGRNWKANLDESGLFTADGSLSQRGMRYLDRNIDITIHETYRTVVTDYDRELLAQVFDKECCMYFLNERAADKLA